VIFETTINCFLASNLLAQFSRQIVVQILGMARGDNSFGECRTLIQRMWLQISAQNDVFSPHKEKI
jgi:hypothetical protein